MYLFTDFLIPVITQTVKSLLPLVPLFIVAVAGTVLLYLTAANFYKKTTYYKITRNPYITTFFNLGIRGEYFTYKELRHFEKDGGLLLFNTYVPTDEGSTSEIDVMLLTRYGIFVFESKNYSGWIFGSESQYKWTQTLPKGRGKGKSHKEQFYNPIMQNRTHIKHLKAYLGEDIPMQSVILFSDRCTLKNVNATSVPVIKRSAVSDTVIRICKSAGPLLTREQVSEIYAKLYPLTQTDDKTKAEHIERIKSGGAKTTPTAAEEESALPTETAKTEPEPTESTSAEEKSLTCPRCGSRLVLRTAKKGSNAGQQFYGCSAYPKCRYTRK